MKTPKPITIDFETLKITNRPVYPPVPVGVSIKRYKKPARYYAWGHLTNNNATWGEARHALEEVWGNPEGLLFQNGKFDIDVAEVHMGLKCPKWDRIHDTMFLLFLDDPDADNLIAEGDFSQSPALLHILRALRKQRTWVGLTDEDFLEACQIAERGNYLVAFQRIQAKLKEKNNG